MSFMRAVISLVVIVFVFIENVSARLGEFHKTLSHRFLVADDAYYSTLAYSYWGAYLGLFGGIYILMACISKSKHFDKFVEICTLESYKTVEAELMVQEDTRKEVDDKKKLEDAHLVEKAKNAGKNPSPTSIICACCAVCASAYEEFPYDRAYHEKYLRGVLDKRCFYNIEYPADKEQSSWFLRFMKHFFGRKSYDLLFHICNQSPIISMGLCSRAHPLSRAEKRNAFFIINAYSLLLAVLALLMHLSKFDMIFYNIFFVVPVTSIIDKIVYYIQACPCLIFHTKSRCLESIKEFLQKLSQIIGFSMALCCLGIYFLSGQLAAINAYNLWADDDRTGEGYAVLGTYMYQIFVISQGVSLFYTISHFCFGYVKFKIFHCIPVFTFGSWELEEVVHYKYNMIVHDKKRIEDQDAFVKSIVESHTIIPCILSYECIKKDVRASAETEITKKTPQPIVVVGDTRESKIPHSNAPITVAALPGSSSSAHASTVVIARI